MNNLDIIKLLQEKSVTKAAALLGVTRNTIYNKLRPYGYPEAPLYEVYRACQAEADRLTFLSQDVPVIKQEHRKQSQKHKQEMIAALNALDDTSVLQFIVVEFLERHQIDASQLTTPVVHKLIGIGG